MITSLISPSFRRGRQVIYRDLPLLLASFQHRHSWTANIWLVHSVKKYFIIAIFFPICTWWKKKGPFKWWIPDMMVSSMYWLFSIWLRIYFQIRNVYSTCCSQTAFWTLLTWRLNPLCIFKQFIEVKTNVLWVFVLEPYGWYEYAPCTNRGMRNISIQAWTSYSPRFHREICIWGVLIWDSQLTLEFPISRTVLL